MLSSTESPRSNDAPTVEASGATPAVTEPSQGDDSDPETPGGSPQELSVDEVLANIGYKDILSASGEPDLRVGMKPDSLQLYEGPTKCSCCTNWVETYPDDTIQQTRAIEWTQRHAVLVRHRNRHNKSYGQSGASNKPLAIDSVVVNSPLIKTILDKEVLTDYSSVTCTLENLVFETPFAPFVHRWDMFKTAIERQEGDAKIHMQLLYDAVHLGIEDDLRTTEDMIANGVISHQYLWMIFKPGGLIFEPDTNHLYIIKSTEKKEHSFEITSEYVIFDGEDFGYKTAYHEIHDYKGTCKVENLDVYPLAYSDRAGEVKNACLITGRKFISLGGIHHKSCKSEEKIVIDAAGYYKYGPGIKPSLTKNLGPDANSLLDEDIMLCSQIIRAFSLKSNSWGAYHVDNVSDIVWTETVFTNLVLPADLKEVLLGFMECHMKNEDEFDDFVEGKGRSLIFLLSGNPGVGKTLTAEAISERLRAPLYSVSARDLGLDASTVDRELETTFNLAKRWKAILLLDEAEVFVSERSTDSLWRNQVVAVFLRLLEYFKGELIMTTNRCSTIDTAILSRIDMHIMYPDLDAVSRAAIWRNFLAISHRVIEIGEDRIDEELANLPLNGRQIKSVIKQAQLLATKAKDPMLRMEYIRRVLKYSLGEVPMSDNNKRKKTSMQKIFRLR